MELFLYFERYPNILLSHFATALRRRRTAAAGCAVGRVSEWNKCREIKRSALFVLTSNHRLNCPQALKTKAVGDLAH
jgi:hypothetical protein